MSGRIFVIAYLTVALAAPVGGARAQQPQPTHPEGFWKVHPPRNVNAEFGKEDPIGLSGRQHISTDCSIAWKDQTAGKIYCFSSPMSLDFFQENPTAYLPKARAFWDSEHPVPRT